MALHEPGTDTDAMIRSADKAMYVAKAGGKGHYVLASDIDTRLVEPEPVHGSTR